MFMLIVIQVMNYFNKMSGGENNIGFNNSVFLSERDTADRNFALAYFMKENKCFPPGFNLQETLDFYFQVKNIKSYLHYLTQLMFCTNMSMKLSIIRSSCIDFVKFTVQNMCIGGNSKFIGKERVHTNPNFNCAN